MLIIKPYCQVKPGPLCTLDLVMSLTGPGGASYNLATLDNDHSFDPDTWLGNHPPYWMTVWASEVVQPLEDSWFDEGMMWVLMFKAPEQVRFLHIQSDILVPHRLAGIHLHTRNMRSPDYLVRLDSQVLRKWRVLIVTVAHLQNKYDWQFEFGDLERVPPMFKSQWTCDNNIGDQAMHEVFAEWWDFLVGDAHPPSLLESTLQ
ncbi:hypothetical protein OF83DRAFT_1086982 [Amylostereum chailletii]|nr:hypothetical protein OF83DRAFT_1086982 [Amylostereum chailletii]